MEKFTTRLNAVTASGISPAGKACLKRISSHRLSRDGHQHIALVRMYGLDFDRFGGSSGDAGLFGIVRYRRTSDNECRALIPLTDGSRANHNLTPSFMQVKCGAKRNSTRSRFRIDASVAYSKASHEDGSTFMC